MLYYEDLTIGTRAESSETHEVTAEEIKQFAGAFDPMPFHLSEEEAARYPMGRLCASSVHTMALCARLAHTMDHVGELAVLGGLGWEECRFPLPVFPGDVLRVRSCLVDKRESRSDPTRGITTTLIEVLKQDGTLAASYRQVNLIRRRPLAG